MNKLDAFNCPVCFNSFIGGDEDGHWKPVAKVYTTSCGHSFCQECVDLVKQTSRPACSVCRNNEAFNVSNVTNVLLQDCLNYLQAFVIKSVPPPAKVVLETIDERIHPYVELLITAANSFYKKFVFRETYFTVLKSSFELEGFDCSIKDGKLKLKWGNESKGFAETLNKVTESYIYEYSNRTYEKYLSVIKEKIKTPFHKSIQIDIIELIRPVLANVLQKFISDGFILTNHLESKNKFDLPQHLYTISWENAERGLALKIKEEIEDLNQKAFETIIYPIYQYMIDHSYSLNTSIINFEAFFINVSITSECFLRLERLLIEDGFSFEASADSIRIGWENATDGKAKIFDEITNNLLSQKLNEIQSIIIEKSTAHCEYSYEFIRNENISEYCFKKISFFFQENGFETEYVSPFHCIISWYNAKEGTAALKIKEQTDRYLDDSASNIAEEVLKEIDKKVEEGLMQAYYRLFTRNSLIVNKLKEKLETYGFDIKIKIPEDGNLEKVMFVKWKKCINGIAATKCHSSQIAFNNHVDSLINDFLNHAETASKLGLYRTQNHLQLNFSEHIHEAALVSLIQIHGFLRLSNPNNKCNIWTSLTWENATKHSAYRLFAQAKDCLRNILDTELISILEKIEENAMQGKFILDTLVGENLYEPLKKTLEEKGFVTRKYNIGLFIDWSNCQHESVANHYYMIAREVITREAPTKKTSSILRKIKSLM